MDEHTILVNVSPDGIMTVDKCEQIISDSVLYKKMHFTFPEEWAGKVVTVNFSNSSKTVTISVILNGDDSICTGENECYVPYEVIKPPYFTVSAFATSTSEGIRITSTHATLRVLQSGYGDDEKPEEPTPSEYEQLTKLVIQSNEIAQSVRDDADSGLFKGEKGDKGDKGDTGAKGDKGDKGEKGEKGDTPPTDQTYSAVSENAQSGKAVAQALSEAKSYTDTKIGSVDTVLDSIISLQNSYIGGESV